MSGKARVAVDLGAESCRVSLLRWDGERADMRLVHRIANGPVHLANALRWPLDELLAGIDEGLRKAAELAPEGIASIGVDGWAVDYVRLDANGEPVAAPYCYRDERTVAAKDAADRLIAPYELFRRTGAQPMRLNTVYQLLADKAAGIDASLRWLNLPEFVLYRLGARPVAEYTNATHTGLVDVETRGWADDVIETLGLSRAAFPEIVSAGSVIGRVRGRLAELDAYRETLLIAPACHDTASAIAGIAAPLDETAYIALGTWSLVGTLVDEAVTTRDAMDAGFTNQGAACAPFQFHANVNGMWILKQCLDTWLRDGRAWTVEMLVKAAEDYGPCEGVISVDAAPLMLDGDMPARLNEQLRLRGLREIPDSAGNEPRFARLIFESLAARYAEVLAHLEKLLDRRIRKIHALGGGSRNALLLRLMTERTGLPVEAGLAEGSTVGNFAVQFAAADGISRENVVRWAKKLLPNV